MKFLVIGKAPKAYFLSAKLQSEGHLVYLCIEQFDKYYTYDKVIFFDYSNQIDILKFIIKKEIDLVICLQNDELTYELNEFLVVNGVNVYRTQRDLIEISSNLYAQRLFLKDFNIPSLNGIFFEKEIFALNYLKQVEYPLKITAGNYDESYIVSGFLNSRKCIGDLFDLQYKSLFIEEDYCGEEIYLYFINDGVSLHLIGEVYEDDLKKQIISPIPFLDSITKEKIINDIIIKIAQALNSINEYEHACIFGVKLLLKDDGVYVVRIIDNILEVHFMNIINLLDESLAKLIISSYSCSLSDDFYEVKFKNKYAITCKCPNQRNYEIDYLDSICRYFKMDKEYYINIEGSSLAWLKNYVVESLV